MRNPPTLPLAVAFVVLVFFTGCESKYPDRAVIENLGDDENKVLALTKYEKIQRGMTYKELFALLDLPTNRVIDLSDVLTRSLVSIIWHDASHKKVIRVDLRGKVVIEKCQSGLE